MKLQMLKDGEGMTLVDYKPVLYRKGYQVATHGIETKSHIEAEAAIDRFGGNCGVWFSEGIYYIDHSIRVKSKKKALRIGRVCHQISILVWHDMSLLYLK